MLHRAKSKAFKNTSLLLLFTGLAFSVHQIQSKATFAQETYNYDIDSTIPQIEVSESFSKSGGDLPILTVGSTITQTARIGQVGLNRLYGWGPPKIKVTVTGIGVSESVYSQADGYWEFVNLYLPRPVYSTLEQDFYFPEICIQAFDGNLATQPSCIPSYLAEELPKEIGPVLLSPILTIEESNAPVGQQVVAYGKTTPNSKVTISLANQDKPSFFRFVRQVNAYFVPTYEISANELGNFEFNLPTESHEAWKVYATSEVVGGNSPKSTSLDFFALSGFWLFVRRLLAYLQFEAHSFFYVALIEIILIVLLASILKKQSKIGKRPKNKLAKA